MNRVKFIYCAGAMGIALFVVMLVMGGLANLQAATTVAGPINRPHDPVIIAGADLPAFDQVPISELRLYTYDGLDWQPIPMQIDERVVVSNTAVYTTFEDGLLDNNDELVFMGHDAGTMVSLLNWVNNAEARTNPRYALTVHDPLLPGQPGYAYLYQAGTLTGSITSYVAWSHSAQTLTALSYTLSFDPNNFVGVADLKINDNPIDILDRQKVRVDVDNPFPIPDVTLNEEDIVSLLGIPATVTLPIVGQVRAVGGGETNSFAFYGRRSNINITVDLDSLPNPTGGTITGLRTSFDLNDPATTSMTPTVYYDSNTVGGVPVDGLPDTVPATPAITWSEISGASGGWVTRLDATVEMGTISNYYLDEATPDPNDTGDGLSFADSGVRVMDPSGFITVSQAVYITSPNPNSQGSIVQDWHDNPLQVTTAVQGYPEEQIYLPLIRQ